MIDSFNWSSLFETNQTTSETSFRLQYKLSVYKITIVT